MTVTQHITATVALVGAQPAIVDTHGIGGAGSLITITIGSVALWIHDRAAADCYASAWLDGVAAEAALYLPASNHFNPKTRAECYPTIAVHASGADRHAATYNPHRHQLIVTIGYLTWIVCDRDAYGAQVDAWHRIEQLSRLILPAS